LASETGFGNQRKPSLVQGAFYQLHQEGHVDWLLRGITDAWEFEEVAVAMLVPAVEGETWLKKPDEVWLNLTEVRFNQTPVGVRQISVRRRQTSVRLKADATRLRQTSDRIGEV